MTKHITTLNLDPFLRNTIGLHRVFENALDRIEFANTGNYPPYNIIQIDEDNYRIEVAVAGFKKGDVTVTLDDGQLYIKGECTKVQPDEEGGAYVVQGISSKSFERRFVLADHVEVKDAAIVDGVLQVNLERIVPEALKPKTIEIK